MSRRTKEPTKRLSDLCRRAGIPARSSGHTTEHSPHTLDDTLWFQENPGRTHRFRPAAPAESREFGFRSWPALPPGRSWVVIVRQVAPGQRVRAPIAIMRLVADDDETLSALFDDVIQATTGSGMGDLSHAEAEAARRRAITTHPGRAAVGPVRYH